MKNTSRILICLALGILLAACSQFTAGQAPVDLAAIHAAAAATAFVELTKIADVTATSSISITPTATLAASSTLSVGPTDTLTPTIQATRLPTLEPTKIPGLLQSALSVETLDTFNGHSLRRVSGWDRGFDSFRWMDTSHLLLYPIVGWSTLARNPGAETLVSWRTMAQGQAIIAETYPAVINLSSKKIWVPRLNGVEWRDMFNNYLPRWSAKLGALITSEVVSSGDVVMIYSADGIFIKSYQGKLLGISPSGTKILIADDTWIDLSSEKIVDFGWHKDYEGFASFNRPIWSSDETRVYACCYLYGDANTGESFGIPYDNITIDGEKVDREGMGSDLFNSYGTWVLNDTYLLSQWDRFYDSTPSFIPLFDPAAKTYRNLSKLANIPADFQGDPNCRQTSTIPGGRYVWVECYDGSYLVDLATFKSQAYTHFNISDIEWSADGKFALINDADDLLVQILSVSSKELKPLPDNHHCSWWHPVNDILVCLSKDRKTLSLLDARSMSVQKEATLPIAFREVIWSPNSEYITLLAKDGSLWQIDYPTLENLEQLTPAMPGSNPAASGDKQSRVKNVIWSPDGTFLAFIGDLDIYIVDAKRNP